MLAQEEDVIEELDRILTHCVQVDRLATLGTFTAWLGHEINNISSILLGTTELISRDIDEKKPVSKESIDVLHRTSLYVADLVKTILRLESVGSKDDVQLVEVNEVVRDVLRSMKAVGYTKYTSIECDLPDDPKYLFCNRKYLEQILINIGTNAVDALDGDHNGRIDLIVRESADKEQIEISIADNGPGMKPEVSGRAFEPFYTTKKDRRGTGLGLPVVKMLVESMGGSIAIETEPDKGTTVNLIFPIKK